MKGIMLNNNSSSDLKGFPTVLNNITQPARVQMMLNIQVNVQYTTTGCFFFILHLAHE